MSTSVTEAAAPFARVTVMGSRRNVDVVLPTQEPLHVLLPSLLDLLDEPLRLGEYVLATAGGTTLDLAEPLARSGLTDGTLLRLTRQEETPSDPVVFDVVETTQWLSTRVRGLWDERTRPVGLALLAGALWVTVAVLWWRSATPPTATTQWVIAGFAAIAAALCAVLRLTAASWLSWALGVGVALWAVHAAPASVDRPLWSTGVTVTALAVAGVCSGRWKAFVGAAALLTAVTAAWTALTPRAGSALLSAAVIGVALVVLAGFLPRLALQLSGVFRMDAAVTDGAVVRRRRASTAIDDAHWTLAAAVCVASALMAAVAWRFGTSVHRNWWQLALLADLVTAWSLRARHLPLLLERVATGVASVALLAAAAATVLRAHPGWLLPVLVVLAVAAAAVSVWHRAPVSAYGQAIARRWADRVESISVAALVPLLVGAFGVYADLTRTFS